MLSEDKWELWDSIVPIRAKDLYNGMELDNLLELQAILSLNEKEADTFYNAKQILERQGHSGLSYSLTVSMVKEFCTNGEKFVEYLKG